MSNIFYKIGMVLLFPFHILFKVTDFITKTGIIYIALVAFFIYNYIPFYKAGGAAAVFPIIIFVFLFYIASIILGVLACTAVEIFYQIDRLYYSAKRKALLSQPKKNAKKSENAEKKQKENKQENKQEENKKTKYDESFFRGYSAGYKRGQEGSEPLTRKPSDAELALSVFMLDAPVPLDELKKRKNFLLKKLHPDANSDYNTTEMTNKILQAYEVLKKNAK